MDINHSEYTIAEIIEGFTNKSIRINRDYQRSAGIWPESAKSYFIDTILEKYPFPKLYFHQMYDRTRKKPVMEVVDGQQRLQAIVDFFNDKLRLSKASFRYAGLIYSELDPQVQDAFIMYRVPVDVLLAVDQAKLLEMFRRMNAYTAPLIPAEKRHSIFQGKFKWFVVELADRISPILEEFGILTTKQIVRMADAELIAELVIVLEQGLINRSEKSIDLLYRKYEGNFSKRDEYYKMILSFFEMLAENFGELRCTHLMKAYAIHSFFAAYAQIKTGIPNGTDDIGVPPRKKKIKADEATVNELLSLADAHETKDVEGRFGNYVNASIATTTKVAQRKIRTKTIAKIIDPK